MSIFPRPLKQVLGRIIPFSQEDKIPTFNLGSGTADSTTYLRGDGTWATVSAPPSGITIGTTSIASGVAGRVLFEGSGNVLQENANFYWDNTNSRLSIGQGSSPGAVIDVRAAGTTSTDIAWRVRNSANTDNLGYIAGNGLSVIGINASTSPTLIIDPSSSARATLRGNSSVSILLNNSGWNNLNGGSGGWDIEATGGEIRQRNGSNYTLLSGNFFGIGRTPAARLDVQAQGALSTDLALRVRNSANNDNIIVVKGDQSIDFLGAGTGGYINLSRSAGNVTFKHRATATLPSQFIISSYGDGGSIGQIVFDTVFGTNAAPTFTMQRFISGLSDLTGSSLYTPFGANAAVFVMKNALNYAGYGIIPTGTATDHFAMYAADIVAGNAAPHFRTEAGDIIKLYKQTTAVTAATFVTNTSAILNDTATFDGYTIGQVVKALRNLGILA